MSVCRYIIIQTYITLAKIIIMQFSKTLCMYFYIIILLYNIIPMTYLPR